MSQITFGSLQQPNSWEALLRSTTALNALVQQLHYKQQQMLMGVPGDVQDFESASLPALSQLLADIVNSVQGIVTKKTTPKVSTLNEEKNLRKTVQIIKPTSSVLTATTTSTPVLVLRNPVQTKDDGNNNFRLNQQGNKLLLTDCPVSPFLSLSGTSVTKPVETSNLLKRKLEQVASTNTTPNTDSSTTPLTTFTPVIVSDESKFDSDNIGSSSGDDFEDEEDYEPANKRCRGNSPTSPTSPGTSLFIDEGLDSRGRRNINKRGRKPLDKQDLICYHCLTRVTPEWRRGPSGLHTLCNACGLKYAKILKRPPVQRNSKPGDLQFILNKW